MNKAQLIQEVKEYLSMFEKPDEKVLSAIYKVDRKDFMDKNKELAYLNQAIPIGKGQTISQPSTVARMISLLNLKKSDKVLEIGTGSLWNAAIISQLCKKVLTLEIVPELAKTAQEKIKKQKLKNIIIKIQDFRELKQKFNKIIFTAGILAEQESLIEDFAEKHLKENGILVCPYRKGPLIIIKNNKNKITKTYSSEEYVFVPLVI